MEHEPTPKGASPGAAVRPDGAAAQVRANQVLWDGWTETPDADFRGVSHSWRHPFEEIVGALIEAGLTVTSLREYDYLCWRWFPWMTVDEGGRYRLPEGLPRIPLMFSLTATSRPAAVAPRR